MGYTVWPDGKLGEILQLVHRERLRQDDLKEEGKFAFTCADQGITHHENYTVLGEEFGEVGHVLNEALGGRVFDMQELRKELIQIAAVAVAWVEKVDNDIEAHKQALARRK